MTEHLIQAQGLHKFFGENHAVNDVSLHIAAGEIYGLVGSDGAGKTTTLRLLVGALQADTGKIEVGGYDVRDQVDIEPGDFLLFRTDWSEFVGTERYYDHPELSLEVVEWLIAEKINAVGIDALGLGQGRRHGEYDRLLARHDIFVIENLTNLAAIPQRQFRTYCLPLKIENSDAIPARVVVEIDDQGRDRDFSQTCLSFIP